MSVVKFINVVLAYDDVEILAEDGMQAEYLDEVLRTACRLALKPKTPTKDQLTKLRTRGVLSASRDDVSELAASYIEWAMKETES